jgi:hypothetical protein
MKFLQTIRDDKDEERKNSRERQKVDPKLSGRAKTTAARFELAPPKRRASNIVAGPRVNLGLGVRTCQGYMGRISNSPLRQTAFVLVVGRIGAVIIYIVITVIFNQQNMSK